jgi:hypothetical protein
MEEAITGGRERELELALKHSERSNAELRERLEVYWKRLDVDAHDRIGLCTKIAELMEENKRLTLHTDNLMINAEGYKQDVVALQRQQVEGDRAKEGMAEIARTFYSDDDMGECLRNIEKCLVQYKGEEK